MITMHVPLCALSLHFFASTKLFHIEFKDHGKDRHMNYNLLFQPNWLKIGREFTGDTDMRTLILNTIYSISDFDF